MELLASGGRTGYLLKSRVTDIEEFIETLERIVNGASVIDPALVQRAGRRPAGRRPADVLSPREREVLGPDGGGPLERGHRPAAVGHRGHRREARRSILAKLDLPETEDDHRRVLAVITYLDSR